MKTCTKCQQDLPETSFHKKGNKLRSACKDCINEQNRARHALTKDSKNAKAREYYKENKPKFAESQKKYRRSEAGKIANKRGQEKFAKSAHGKAAIKKSQKKYAELNKQKRKCHWAVKSALKSGKLVKNPCETCGAKKSEAHHLDYTKPLKVVWLCNKHHKELHRKYG